MLGWARPVSLVGGHVITPGGIAASIRFGRRVLAFDEPPARGDAVVDLGGSVVLPGLVNAHDHLELNHYGALRPRPRYDNALDWIDDLRPIIRSRPDIVAASRQPLASRLFIGGLKNLLAGVTTVAHHNPMYRGISRAVPIRLVRRFGWAHSLGMEDQPVGACGEPGGDVRARYRATPREAPFIVHAGEGVDQRALDELPRLHAAGCVGANSVLVHGVAWRDDDWRQVVLAGGGLVWCPASNHFLFGRTAAVPAFLASSTASLDHVCLGSDSRLTGARDLLDELHVARVSGVAPAALLAMVTTTPAHLLRLPDAGTLRIGSPADFVVVPSHADGPGDALVRAARRDLRLVVVGGQPMTGAPGMQAVFAARAVRTVPAVLDGEARLLNHTLARAIVRCPINEPGVSLQAGT